VEARLPVDLGGVPETLLWTLYHRAVEARRPDGVLDDPKAVELVERIDYPFEERFGRGRLAQWQALRVRCFDREIRRFLAAHPDATVVALGEGLETQFWRVDNGRVRWVGVDLPETVALRARLLPDEPRRRSVACSALDERWMDEIDTSRGVLVTAQGLLMYFEPPDVHRLIAACAERFGGGALLFDAMPRWLGAASRRGGIQAGGGYRPPPWLWAIDAAEERRLAGLDPDIVELRALRLPRGRGVIHGFVLPLLSRVAAVRRRMLTVYEMRFRWPGGHGGSVAGRR
jgi:O-methyltransferase involved in polyketide biosynthesis